MAFNRYRYDRLNLVKFSFTVRRAHLRVVSAVCSNLVAGWLVVIFVTPNLFVLTLNILAAMVSLYIAFKAEEALEKI